MPATTMDAHELLQQHFGWNDFRPGQLDVIQRLLDGKSVLSVFPTGGGKSLCYQLPALALDGLTVVVSPLIALMKDQIDQLASRGIRALRLDSTLSRDEFIEAMDAIRKGTAKLLYVAPERFFNERFRATFEGTRVSLFAIDEAHCISQWGHNFRPDYLKLARIAAEIDADRVLCLTATAAPLVQKDICAAFQIDQGDVICTEFYRSNLHLRSLTVSSENQQATLIERLRSDPPGATIVYVTLQKTAEQIADACVGAGLEARPYHAGMDAESRHEIQEWFMSSDQAVVVATIAFGMGIDKANIRRVYHYNPPKSIENYAQEIGRAGRDGETAHCVMLFNPDDMVVLENFIYGDTPDEDAIRKLVEHLASQPKEFFISQYQLAAQCDIKTIVLKTLLTYLELDGLLEPTAVRYDAFTFKPYVPSAKILQHFREERRQFLRKILSCSQQRKTWFYLDVPKATEVTGADRARVVRAVEYLAEKGWIELRTTGLMHGYRKLKPMESIDQLSEELFQRVSEREEGEISRIHELTEFAAATSCQAAQLSAHFGQSLAQPCGNCTACRGDDVVGQAEPNIKSL